MGCGCKKAKYDTGEATIMSEGDKVLILYTHPNIGKKIVNGPATGTRYGYYGGGQVFEVFKDDIRMRPAYFGTCGNCRQPLTINKNDVFCPRCSTISSAIINRPSAEAVAKAINNIEPEPEKIQDPVPVIREEDLEKMLEVSNYAGRPLDSIDFGRSVNSRHLDLLAREGITTIEEAVRKGPEELMAIKGIGQKIVDALMSKA